MGGNEQKPIIRFRGFTDAWEQRKLGEVASSFEYGLNAAAKEFDGMNKYLRITDIDDLSRSFRDDDLTSPDTDLSTASNYQLREGEIVFARTGASVGKSFIYRESDGLVYFAGFLIRAKIKPEYDSEFVFQNTLGTPYEKYIQITSQRSGQPGVNAQEYAEYAFLVPDYAEQKKIGSFLRQIDNLITLHQREHDKLINVKKSMLEKMFPREGSLVPEIRFAGFTDPWAKCKLGEHAVYRRGSFPQPYGRKEWYDGEDSMPFVQVVDVTDNMRLSENTKQRISKLAQPMSVFAKRGQVLVTLQGSIGRVAVAQYDTYVDRTVLIFEKYKKETDTDFWSYVIKQKFIEEARSAPGGTIKTITKEALSDFDLFIPDLKEQILIGRYFKKMDEYISLYTYKLDSLHKIKTAMLERMFV